MATLTSSYQYLGRSDVMKSVSGSLNYYLLLYAKTSANETTGIHTVTILGRLASTNNNATFYNYNAAHYGGIAGYEACEGSGEPKTAWDYNSSGVDIGGVTYKTYTDIASGSVDVDCTNGLSKTINVFFKWTMATNQSASYTPSAGASRTVSVDVTLPAIPRASEPTVSASSVTMLDTVTITTNRLSSSFTHDLTYKFNGYEGTIATGVGASYKWTVPDLVSKISGKKSGTCTIYCKTKSGSTTVGTESVSLTLKIPAKSTPSASASSVQMGTSVNIYTNRKSSGYTHTLSYEMGDQSGTIDTGVEGGRTWTPPKTLANYTDNKTSAICTITCKTYNGSLLVGTATSDIILTVPSATVPTLSASSIVLGNPITISTPREVSCYEHDISYTLKAKGSSTVAFSKDFSGAVQEEYEWTPSLSLLAPEIPSATEGTITIYCTTRFKDSTTEVGTETASFTVTVPNNSTTKPKLTATFTPVHDLSSAFDKVYVQGKSKAKVSLTATSNYSTIASYETEMLGVTSNANPYTSSVLSNEGNVTVICRATDARGYTAEQIFDLQVTPYSRPRITPGENRNNIICTRCNSDGTADAGGVWLLINIGRKYSKVIKSGSQKNYCSLSYCYKTDSQEEDDYSNPITILEKSSTSDYVLVTLKDIVSSNTTAYNVKLIAEDDVGDTDTVIVTVPTAFVTWHSPPGGHGFTLGGYHDPSKVDVFDCRFDAEFQGDVCGKVLGMGALPEIPENANFDEYKDFGAFAVAKNTIAKTITNCPIGKAGTLRVWSANGAGNTIGSYVYIMQEYVPYDNSASYRRSMQLPSADSVWEYGEWTLIGNYSEGLTDGWYWRKYTDGTAECWKRVKNTSRDISTQFGSMYYGNCDEVEFPFSFYSAPIVNASVESGTALILMSWQGTDGNGTTTATKPASYRVVRPTSITGASFTIAYHAIGRWKE